MLRFNYRDGFIDDFRYTISGSTNGEKKYITGFSYSIKGDEFVFRTSIYSNFFILSCVTRPGIESILVYIGDLDIDKDNLDEDSVKVIVKFGLNKLRNKLDRTIDKFNNVVDVL